MREIFGPARLIDLREWLVFEVSAGGGMRWGDGTLLAGRGEGEGGQARVRGARSREPPKKLLTFGLCLVMQMQFMTSYFGL